MSKILLSLLLLVYYLPFAFRGLVFSDEGVYTYTAEMISRGFTPYIDFFLEYPPGYFYLLALLYKLFGSTVIVGRFLSLGICLGIFFATLNLLKAFKIRSKKKQLFTLLCIASFGYPLLNIPLLTWPSVLITVMLMIQLLTIQQKNSWKPIIFTGFLIGLQFALKQNIAVTELLLIIGIFFFIAQGTFVKKLKQLVVLNSVWVGMTVVWVYYFFLRNNLDALREFLDFNSRIATIIYPFSYPSISMIMEPLGFIKLIPYYFPILMLGLIIYKIIKNPQEKRLYILLLPLNGFFTTIYPVSELLHVYPYFGLILVTAIIYHDIYIKKYTLFVSIFIFITCLSGLYLTFFKGYNRYQLPYKFQSTQLQMPKAQYIFVDKESAKAIQEVAAFLDSHTKQNDPIFSYPFMPMNYFLFSRTNASRYPIYQKDYLSIPEENQTIRDLRKKKVKYIITNAQVDSKTPLSNWVNKQKLIKNYGMFQILEITTF